MMKKLKLSILVIKKIKNWRTYFLNYLRLIKNRYIIFNFRSGLKIKVRSKSQKDADREVISSVLLSEEYNQDGFKINRKNTIIDIGAHIGAFSVLAGFIAEEGKVYSYEPEESNFNLLLENIKLNKLYNVIPFKLAVSNSSGKKKLYLGESTISHSMFNKEGEKYNYVTCVTLKEILDSNKIRKCDFLKMDCEGAEFEILYSTPIEYLRRIQRIVLEFHDLNNKALNHKQLIKFLEKRGFKIVKLEINKGNGPFIQQGLLFAKKDKEHNI